MNNINHNDINIYLDLHFSVSHYDYHCDNQYYDHYEYDSQYEYG